MMEYGLTEFFFDAIGIGTALGFIGFGLWALFAPKPFRSAEERRTIEENFSSPGDETDGRDWVAFKRQYDDQMAKLRENDK